MQLTIAQQGAKEYLVNIWQQDPEGTDSRDDDRLMQTQVVVDDDSVAIELQPGQYLTVDPMEDDT